MFPDDIFSVCFGLFLTRLGDGLEVEHQGEQRADACAQEHAAAPGHPHHRAPEHRAAEPGSLSLSPRLTYESSVAAKTASSIRLLQL